MRLSSSRVAATIVAISALACTEITTLKQSSPSLYDASGVYVPANAQLIVTGAIGDFECAFADYVMASALLSDEIYNGGIGVPLADTDARRIAADGPYGTLACGSSAYSSGAAAYVPLSISRMTADTAMARIRSWTDAEMPPGTNRGRMIGQLAAYAGYSIVLLGEGMCSGAINAGPELTPAQLFAEARARFDTAVKYATAANDAATLNLARLGRARTLLNLVRTDPTLMAAAATDAAAIPANFVATTSFDGSSIRRRNSSFAAINQGSWMTPEPTFRNLTINGAPDPRVALTNTNRNGSSQAPIFTPNKYPALSTNMPIARWAEAQFILAEARLAANDLTGAAAAINAVRATWTGLPTYSAAGQTAANVRDQIIEERRRELFLEGHRLGDIRRLNIPFAPAAGAPHATAGGVYGSLTCYPLPDRERINNPNIGTR